MTQKTVFSDKIATLNSVTNERRSSSLLFWTRNASLLKVSHNFCPLILISISLYIWRISSAQKSYIVSKAWTDARPLCQRLYLKFIRTLNFVGSLGAEFQSVLLTKKVFLSQEGVLKGATVFVGLSTKGKITRSLLFYFGAILKSKQWKLTAMHVLPSSSDSKLFIYQSQSNFCEPHEAQSYK